MHGEANPNPPTKRKPPHNMVTPDTQSEPVPPIPAEPPPEEPIIETSDVMGALEVLHVKYPHFDVDIWSKYEKGKLVFTAYVKPTTGGGRSTNATTPMEAATKMIAQLGDYTPEDARTNRIKELREELQKLEEEGRQGGPQA